MQKIFFTFIILVLIACGTAQRTQVNQAPHPTKAPAITPDELLGSIEVLTWYFEHEYQFNCGPSGNHTRCTSPDGLVKIILFGNPVSEATISVPFDAADSKPSKYVSALLLKTGLDNAAWDWLVSQMKQPEMSKGFGSRRLTTQINDEGWLVTVEAIR